MRHLSYVGMLAFCLAGTAPLEIWLGVRVYRRPLRLFLTLLPVLIVFVAWDLYAIHAGQWSFDRSQTLGWTLPGRLPGSVQPSVWALSKDQCPAWIA